MQNNEDENGISNVKSADNPSNLIRKEGENLSFSFRIIRFLLQKEDRMISLLLTLVDVINLCRFT